MLTYLPTYLLKAADGHSYMSEMEKYYFWEIHDLASRELIMCELEVSIGIQNFGIPIPTDNRLGTRLDTSRFIGHISEQHQKI